MKVADDWWVTEWLSLRGERSRSLNRRNKSSWVGDKSREKTCVAEIKREKKNILHSDSSDSINKLLKQRLQEWQQWASQTVTIPHLFFILFFQKMEVARQWLTHAAFFYYFFNFKKNASGKTVNHMAIWHFKKKLIYFFSKNASGKTLKLLDKTTQWWDYSSWHTFFDWER